MAVSPNTDFTTGQVLTAAQQNNFPRGVMGYAKSTADSTSISTTQADVPGMSVTFTAVANRLYRATFECFYSVTSNSQNQFFITDASNNMLDQIYDNSTLTFNPIALIYIFTTTAGSKTYKVRAETSAGTMTIYGATGANRSYSFVVEDLGPA
jgi:hypothetical protein